MQLLPLNDICESIFTGIPPRLKTGEDNANAAEQTIIGIRAISPQGAVREEQFESMGISSHSLGSARVIKVGDVLLTIRGSLAKCAVIEHGFNRDVYASGNLVV